MLASQLASTCMSLLAIQILTEKSKTFVRLSFADIICANCTCDRHQNDFVFMGEQDTFSNIVPNSTVKMKIALILCTYTMTFTEEEQREGPKF